MNQQDQEQKAKDGRLLDQALFVVKPFSVFFSIDHPNQQERGERLDTRHGFPHRQTDAENLAGAKASLEQARKTLALAIRKAEEVDDIATRAGRGATELGPYIWQATRMMLNGDVKRANAELIHWRDVMVPYYQRRVDAAAPVPQDRRLPREPGDDDDGDVPW